MMKLLIKIYGTRGFVVAETTSSSESNARKWVDNWLWYNGDTGYIARCWDDIGNPVFEVAL